MPSVCKLVKQRNERDLPISCSGRPSPLAGHGPFLADEQPEPLPVEEMDIPLADAGRYRRYAAEKVRLHQTSSLAPRPLVRCNR
jgi:hypothetical protein